MVVQDSYEVESPLVEVVTSKLASEKYVVVKNHVRELKITDQELERESLNESKDSKCSKRLAEKRKKLKHKLSNSTEDDKQNLKIPKINTSDLEELKMVYFECKRVIEKIEIKYGHLLNLANENADNSFPGEFQNEEECRCDKNIKIIFDEEGKQIIKETEKDKHICLRKLQSKEVKLIPKNAGIQTEYEQDSLQLEQELPDNLIELSNMLKDSRIELKYRKNIINKIKNLRLDYMNTIRCNKLMLVKQLKMNPEEVLMFEGTNISTLTGYPI